MFWETHASPASVATTHRDRVALIAARDLDAPLKTHVIKELSFAARDNGAVLNNAQVLAREVQHVLQVLR